MNFSCHSVWFSRGIEWMRTEEFIKGRVVNQGFSCVYTTSCSCLLLLNRRRIAVSLIQIWSSQCNAMANGGFRFSLVQMRKCFCHWHTRECRRPKKIQSCKAQDREIIELKTFVPDCFFTPSFSSTGAIFAARLFAVRVQGSKSGNKQNCQSLTERVARCVPQFNCNFIVWCESCG